jgi:gas vesicle protein
VEPVALKIRVSVLETGLRYISFKGRIIVSINLSIQTSMKEYSMGSLIRAGVLGAALGSAAGFALGILLAPEEGQKVRRRVAYQLENLADQVNSFLDSIVNPGEPGDARMQSDAVVADARTKARKIQDEIDALMGEVRRHGPAGEMPTN